MQLSRLGNALVITGAAVGIAVAVAVEVGYRIVLTPAMAQLLVYKGLAAVSLGLMVVGTLIARRGRISEAQGNTTSPGTRATPAATPALHAGSDQSPIASNNAEKEAVREKI